MSAFLNSIKKTIDGNFIIISGIYAKTFLSDVARIYKIDPNNGSLFYSITVNGYLFKQTSMRFHRYFALEIFTIFERLYKITERSAYKEVMKVLITEPQVAAYFKPVLPLPSFISDKLNDLKNVKLFDYQYNFMASYYNAKYKLGLDGYLLAFEQGLGKTYTAIAASYMFDMAPTIITAPRSTLTGWKSSILNMIPSVKPDEVKLISEYNPEKDHTKWKYMICNYERLSLVYSYLEYAVKPPKSLIIDESHNFRYMNTQRSKNLLALKQSLNIKDVIAISGTPIKAMFSEIIPVLSLIDPLFDEKARSIFYRIYSKNYNDMVLTVLKRRLNIFMERQTQEDHAEELKLPKLERYNVDVTIADPSDYLVVNVKRNIQTYIEEHAPEYAGSLKPNYENFKEMVNALSWSDKLKLEYIRQVEIKMNRPLSEEGINAMATIKDLETDKVITKDLIVARKKCTSYMQMLMGKALGVHYMQAKILALVQMVKENLDDLIKIIESAEKKVMIFSTYIAPLEMTIKMLEGRGIGCILYKSGSDFKSTLELFKNDNTIKCFMGTAAVSTGSDGLQYVADVLIFLSRNWRSSDDAQTEARLYRKGNDTTVKIYYMNLDTGKEPNLVNDAVLINDWSRKMLKAVME